MNRYQRKLDLDDEQKTEEKINVRTSKQPRTVSKNPVEKRIQEAMGPLRKKIHLEILDHKNWCGKNCQTFLPSAYLEHRLIGGYSKKTVQDSYDMCHIFR